MGTSAQAFVLLGSTTVSMKLLLACLLPLALSSPEAEPHYGHGLVRHKPQCRTVYDTVTSSSCRSVTDTACTTKIVTSVRTETREDCTTVTDQKCDTTTRDVPEEQCATFTETECNDVVRQVPEQVCDTVEEEVCNDEAQCTEEEQCEDITNVVLEQKCDIQSQCTQTEQCTTEQQCTTQEQCTTETRIVPETTFREECQDIVTNVCQEVQTEVRVAQQVINHPAVVAAPAVPAVQTLGLAAPAAAVGPLVGALGLNPARLVVKRDAEAEAEADPQLLLNGFGGLVGGRVVGVAVPAAVGPVSVGGPVAPMTVVSPQCQQKVERQCRSVPVQTSRAVASPKCQSVPVCVPVPKCVTVPFTVPVETPVEECSPVTRQVCQPVHKQVA